MHVWCLFRMAESGGDEYNHESNSGSADDAVSHLAQFLNDCCCNDDNNWLKEQSRRCTCPSCGASRSMYCYDCCEILMPMGTEDDERRTFDLEEVRLPCAVDIILDDRRASATGVHAFSVLQKTSAQPDYYRLLDQTRGDGIPDYTTEDGVYFLFPSDTSVGLASVGPSVRRLVVLDCKWTKSYLREDPRLAKLPKVHLDNPPRESFYWRWHNSGSGMLCTIEAIYFAAWQLAEQQKWTLAQRRTLVHLLWIFRVQRAVIRRQYETGKGHRVIPYMPFDKDGKECARKFREKEIKEK